MPGGSFPFLSSLLDSLPSVAPIEELPHELAEDVISHLARQDLLNFRKASRSINEMVAKRTPALCRPDKCHLQILRLHQLLDTLHISSLAVDLPMAQYLVPLSYHAKGSWKRWAGEKVDCFATFEFPPTSSFSFFESATIGHLQIAKQLPIYVEGRRLQQLKQLLVGCSVEKTTLVFDKQTMSNLHSVPSFLHFLSCRRVEFVLEKSFEQDMLTPFTEADLASALVAAGVTEVALSGVPYHGRAQPDQPDGPPTGEMEAWNLYMRVLSNLFSAGIKYVDAGRHTLENDHRQMTVAKLLSLINVLTSLGRPLVFRLHLSYCIERLPAGPFPMSDDNQWSRRANENMGRPDFSPRGGGGVALPVDCGGRGSPRGGRGGRGGARGEMRGGKSLVMAFTFVAFCYLMALIVAAFCIFFAIYTVICIDELKTDYKNPIEQCRSLHILVLPEYILHGIATVCNVPLVIFHAYTYSKRPVMSGPGIYDPTTILDRTELSRCMRSWVKLAFYLISFFYYLYGLIYTLVTN